MEKLEALDRLEEIGSHSIIRTATANEIGEPFGLEFKEVHFVPNGDPKGPLNDCFGVSTFEIASRIAEKVGALDRQFYFGRGTQFRSDVEATKKVLGAV